MNVYEVEVQNFVGKEKHQMKSGLDSVLSGSHGRREGWEQIADRHSGGSD